MQLNQSEYLTVTRILKKFLPKAKFYLFGSRAKQTAKPYSDLDILVVDQDKIPLHRLNEIEEEFDQSNLTFTVDLVDWYRVTQEFRNHLNQERIPL
jgi:predicted nucleotidyltransferase